MEKQNTLPASSILKISQTATITRLMPPTTTGDMQDQHSRNEAGNHEKTDTGVAKKPGTKRNFSERSFSQAAFLRHLQREKRRSERSNSPLSIVLYRIEDTADGDVGEMLNILSQVSRETDIVGYLYDDLLAVLCPDTDENGINAFVNKIEETSRAPWLVVGVATYPDQLFDSLTDEGKLHPVVRRLVIDSVDNPAVKHGYRMKRSIDVIGSIVLLILFSPLMLLVAILVAVTSPGPIIFKQKRLGREAKEFTFYKFRSMAANTDDSIHRDFVSNLINGKNDEDCRDGAPMPVYKIKADPRVTWIGRIIRKTSIDELPQLFNVLKGEMSLVGPRPPIAYEAEIYQPWHLRRLLSVKPGITGLWQVEARSSVTFDEMVRLDLRYIRDCSLILDIKILLKTVLVVIRCAGAV